MTKKMMIEKFPIIENEELEELDDFLLFQQADEPITHQPLSFDDQIPF